MAEILRQKSQVELIQDTQHQRCFLSILVSKVDHQRAVLASVFFVFHDQLIIENNLGFD